MDQFDRVILKLLSHNAKMSNSAIGAAVGLSASAAHRRVKALEADGHIKGYAAILSDEAVGHTETVIVSISLDNQRDATFRAFEKAIRKCIMVRNCHLTSGEYDYVLTVTVSAAEPYEQIHRDVLSKLPGVKRLVSSYAIRTIV